MEFSERKQKILQAIIRDYIDTAEPVGSRTIAKKYAPHLSSATIRNEMADLEDMGLITQPHTSAGRIPSHLGYRFYVDHLMQADHLTSAEVALIKKAFHERMSELDLLIGQVADIISELTQYTSVVISPEMTTQKIMHTELIYIDGKTSLLVMVFSNSMVKNKKIQTHYEVQETFIRGLSEVLNEILAGMDTNDVDAAVLQQIYARIKENQHFINTVFELILNTLQELCKTEIYLSGSTNLLNYPEYRDIEKVRDFFNFLNQKNNLMDIVKQSSKENTINITIGKENLYDEMHDNSMLVSTYSVGGKIFGKIGIIGPTRMDYPRIVSSLETVTKSLNNALHQYFFGEEK